MRIWLLGLLLGVAGCSASHDGGGSADRPFRSLANEYISGYLAWRPQTGTSLGLHEFDGKLTDYSSESVASELRRLKNFAARLGDLNTSQLSARAFYDYRILRASIQREIFGFEDMGVFTLNPMTYAGAVDVNIYIKRDFAPLPERVRSVISVLGRTPAVMAAARSNLVESLPRPQVEVAIQEADGAADFLAKDVVTAVKDLKDEALRLEFDKANQVGIAEFKAFSEWLRKERLPKANENYALGREKYARLLASGEMVKIAPEQLLELGLRELRAHQRRFAETAGQIDGSKSPVEVFKSIQAEHPTAAGLIPDTARHLELIRQFVVDHRIVTVPSEVRAKVQETPQYARAASFASMDTPGPFEKRATQAYYYVTPVEPEWTPHQQEQWLTAFNFYTTDVVSIHEAYPGHYVQFLCLNASPANQLEKMFTSYAFVEGWAHYAEQMMLDEGFGTGPISAGDPGKVAKYRLAQLDEALLRLCRFCVSIRMHCQRMTVEEATKFFQENCYYEEKPARQEAIRGAYDPEYLYYTLGKLELLKLREDYRQQEGAAFQLQQFHDEVLRHGAPPVVLLRELMLKDRKLWESPL